MALRQGWPLLLAGLWMSSGLGAAQLEDSLAEQRRTTQGLQKTQQQIEQLDDRSQQLWGRYQQALRQSRLLAPHVRDQEQQLEQLRAKRAALEMDLSSLDASRQGLVPLQQEMWQRLQQFVALDTPVQAQERAARLQRLEQMLADPTISQPQRLEQLWAAYQVELAYSRGLEAWQGPIPGLEQSGTLLRLGRTALYYLTPDGSAGGLWQAGGWQPLDSDQIEQVRLGVAVARQQEPPQLLRLPLSLPQIQGGAS